MIGRGGQGKWRRKTIEDQFKEKQEDGEDEEIFTMNLIVIANLCEEELVLQ